MTQIIRAADIRCSLKRKEATCGYRTYSGACTYTKQCKNRFYHDKRITVNEAYLQKIKWLNLGGAMQR